MAAEARCDGTDRGIFWVDLSLGGHALPRRTSPRCARGLSMRHLLLVVQAPAAVAARTRTTAWKIAATTMLRRKICQAS